MPMPIFNPESIKEIPGKIWFVQADQPQLLQRLTLPDLQAEFILNLPRDQQEIRHLSLSPDAEQLLYLKSDQTKHIIHSINLSKGHEEYPLEISPDEDPQHLVLLPGFSSQATCILAKTKAGLWRLLHLKRHESICLGEYRLPETANISVNFKDKKICFKEIASDQSSEDYLWLDPQQTTTEKLAMPKALHSLWFKPDIDRLWTSPSGQYWAFISHEKKARLFIARQDSPKKRHELHIAPFPHLDTLYWSPCENWLAWISPEGLVISHRYTPIQTLLPRLNNLRALAWTD